MAIVFKNNASTTLSAALSSSATSISVADATKLPSITGDEYFFCTIDDGSNVEIVKVTGISSNTLTVVRAQDNTTALSFSSGDIIEQRLTAAVLETFPQLDVGELTADEFIGDLRGAVIFKAQAGEAIDKGEVVYVSGISGNTPVVALADADDANKMPAFGLALESASLNNSLAIVTFGTISGVDTDTPGFSLGDTLYVSTTPGGLTNSPPAGESSLIQNIGKVQRVHASSGSIKVGGAGRTNAVPNLNDGNIFIGNASNQATTASLNTKIEDYLDANGTTFPDNVKAQFGASNDLQIYHDGSASYISDQGTGNLFIQGGNFRVQNPTGTETYILANENAEVKLYYDNASKLATTSSGIDVTGTVVADNLLIDTDVIVTDSTNDRVGINKTSPATTLDVGGSIFFSGLLRGTSDGSASSPTIQPGLDGDTGLYRPAINQIGFTTGGTNALTLDSSQNATFAGTILSSQADNNDIEVRSVGDYFPSLTIARTSGTTKTDYEWNLQIGSSGYLNFKDITNSYYPLIFRNNGDVYLASDTSSANPVLILDQSAASATFAGDVTLAEYLYHSGNTGTNLRFQTDRATLTSGGGASVDAHSNGNLYLTGTTVQVYGNYNSTGTIGSDKITVTHSGAVPLDLHGSATGISYISLANTATAATNNGSGIEFRANSSTQERQVGYITAKFTNTTDASRESQITFQTASAGSQVTPLYLQGEDAVFGGDVTVPGNLYVTGSSTAVNVEDLNVEQGEITLNYSTGDSSASANGSGIRIQDAVNSTTDATILWNATNDRFEFSHDVDLPIDGAKIRFGGSSLGGPHGLIFYDDDGTSSFSMFYRTSPNTITLEIEGDVAKHTFERDGSYTAEGDVVVKGALTLSGSTNSPITFVGTGTDTNSRNFAYEASGHHYVTNRHTSGDLVLMSNNGTGGGETARITLQAGSGTQDIDITNANLDLNSNNITGVGAFDLSGNLSVNGTNVLQSSGNNLVNIGVVTATGQITTDSHVQSGDGSGGVALTINDGYGNANITWNHLAGTPEQNGNAARIEVNTDSTSGATMDFEVLSNVTSGTAVSLDHVLSINETGLKMLSGHVIYSTGTMRIEATDSDFEVADTTDGLTNFIWRDWSAGKLYLGTSNAVATLRSTLDLNSNNITNVGTISSGAITLSNDSSDMGFGTAKAGSTVGHTASVDEGIFWHTTSDYGIYRTAGAWTSPYPVLKIKFATGVEIDGGVAGQYGDINFSRSNLKIGGTQFLDQSRNLTNIGTISSGAITTSGALTLSIDGTDALNFSANSTNDARGISFNGRTALSADYSDGYLRLNNQSEFSNGVYTPANFRADGYIRGGSFRVGTTTVIDTSRNLTNIGTISSGQISATTTADGTPAIIATNTGGIGSTIQRWVGDSDSMEMQCVNTGDYKLVNTQQLNGIAFYDGTGGVEIHYNGSVVQSWNSSGGTNIASGGLLVGGTTVMDSSRNLTNIGTISSGAITSTGTISATSVGVTNIVTNKVVKFDGSVLDDSNITDTGSAITLGSQTTVTGDLTVSGNNVFLANVGARVKYSVWSNNTYGIGMETGYTFGGIANNYVMSFQMSNTAGRGFWWGDDNHTNAQGAMALTTDGYLTVANGIRVGYGETDTTTPGAGLDVNGNVACGNITLANNSTLQAYTSSGGSGTGSIHMPRGGFLTFYGDNNTNHGIGSRNAAGAIADDLRINSYGAVYINLDANNNNTAGADFVIGRHGGGAGSMSTLVTISGENGDITTTGDLTISGGRLTNDTGTILDSDGSSNYIKGGSGGTGILYTEASTFYVNNPMHLNVGRGVCYFESNSNSNSNGAGVTLRTSSNPSTGSIFDVRSSGQACRFFSGQSLTSAGTNPFYVGTPATGNEYTGSDYEILLNTNGDIVAEGNITAYGTVSDIRQKENIEQIDKPIERLEKIKGITFNYKKKSEDERLMGVIAQDLLKDDILKLAVYEQEDFKAEDDDPLKHTYGVRYEHLTAILIEAVKEQQKQIESLKSEINNLKGEK